MTALQIISDIKRILSKNNITQDNRFEDLNLLSMYNAKRASLLYELPFSDSVQEVSNLGLTDLTLVGLGDDPLVQFESIKVGKTKIPEIITLRHSNGIHYVSTSSRQTRIYPTTLAEFTLMVRSKHARLGSYNYYFVHGNDLFVYPHMEKCQIMLFLANPMDGYFIDTTNKTVLEVGQSYVAFNMPIIYNSITRFVGIPFTAVSGVTSFTGEGVVRLENYKRSMKLDDPYPDNTFIRDKAIRSLLTNEFRIEADVLTDLRLTGNDESILNKEQ